MSTSIHLAKLTGAVGFIFTLSLPFAGEAAFPLTAAGNGNNSANAVQWYITDNAAPIGGPISGGLGLSDGDYNNAGKGLDAYDGAFAMRINNVYFVAAAGATLSGNVFDSTVVNSGNYSVQVKYTFFADRPIVRAIYSFTASAATTLDIRWDANLGSDSGTTIHATSTGGQPTINAVNDRWFVASDNGANGDVINTVVRYGTNYIQRPQGDSTVPNGGTDLLSDHYSLTLAPSENKKLMMFGVLGSLTDGAGAAQTSAALFDNYQNMLAAGLFDGLSSDLQNIVNWGVVPEPNAGLLLVAGLGALLLRRRWLAPNKF
jgi:hypothetical protein